MEKVIGIVFCYIGKVQNLSDVAHRILPEQSTKYDFASVKISIWKLRRNL